METVGTIIQRIQSLYSKGVQSDDSRLTPRHIYSKMVTVRNRLLFQKSNKKQKINQWNYQVLPCVELIAAPIHECPCLPPVGCQILRSKNPLPKPLSGLNNHLLQYVSSLDGSIIYSEVSFQEYKYKKGNKYTSNKPDYWVHNGYLYITHKSGPKLITASGIFEDPLAQENYTPYCEECEDCKECESMLDKVFPLDGELIEPLIELATQELVVLFSQIPQDSTNNSKDDNLSLQND